MGCSLSEGLLLAFMLYPLNSFKAAAFVHPKATFGWSSWTHDQSRRLRQPTCCGEPSPSSSGRRPRQRGERSCNEGVRMQADATDMETQVPGAASSSLTQFDNRER